MIPFIHLGPLRLGTYGLMVWLGLVVGYWVLQRNLRRRKLPGDALNMILIIGFSGLASSKLWHLLERPTEFFADPLGTFFSSYGFAWFGGFAGGVVAIILLGRHYRVPLLTLLDACAPAAALGYAFGRIGCLLSGDGDYGIPTSLPWCMSFPNGLVPTTDCVHPTPVYEFLSNAAVALLLWKLGPRPDRPSFIFAAYLLLTGAARFLVEFIRINPRVLWGLTNAQVASLGSILAGLFLLAIVRGRPAEAQA